MLEDLPWAPSTPIHLGKILGKGYLGTVYLGRYSKTQKLVAVKFFPRRLLDHTNGADHIIREIGIREGLPPHPQIIDVLEAYQTSEGFYVVTKYYAKSLALDEYLVKLDAEERLFKNHAMAYTRLMLDILTAVEHLHKYGIVHRDLKPENIMLTSTAPVLIDFDAACIPGSELYPFKGLRGTRLFIAPEVFSETVTDYFAVDIYALGIIFYLLANSNQEPTPESVSNSGWPKLDNLINKMRRKTGRPSLAKIRSTLEQLLAD